MAGGTINLLFRISKKDDALPGIAKGLDNTREKVNDLGKAALELGRTFGGVNTAVGGIAKTFLTGGIFQLAAQGISLLVTKWNELKERAVESAKAFGEAMQRAAEASEKRFKQMADAISAASARAKDLLRLSEARGSLHSTAETERVNVRARNAMARTSDESERAVIKANAQLEIARIHEAEQSKRAAANVRAADAEVGRAEERLEAAERVLEDAKKRERDADVRATVALRSENDERIKVANENHYKAIEARKKAEELVAQEEEKVAAAENALKTARAAAAETRIKASEAVSEASFQLAEAQRKQKQAAEERAKADQKKAEAEKKEADAQAAKAAKEQLEAEMLQREMKQEEQEFEARQNMIEYYDLQAEQGKKHLREITPRVKRLDAQIDALTLRLKKAKEGIERTGRGQEADARHTTGVFGPYQYGGRANGGENYTDWQRAQRFAGRADRDAEKAARRDAAAQKRYNRLSEERSRGRRLSDRDRGFMRDFEAFQDQKNGAENLQQQLEKAQQKRDQLQQHIDKTLEQINQNIKDALAIA